ncbi:MAG: hypothetical protein LBO80_04935, partial [Treponema sp.]|nr:hypothetical protein [Treponema sp.]
MRNKIAAALRRMADRLDGRSIVISIEYIRRHHRRMTAAEMREILENAMEPRQGVRAVEKVKNRLEEDARMQMLPPRLYKKYKQGKLPGQR